MTLTACTAALLLMVIGVICETDISEVDTLQMPGKGKPIKSGGGGQSMELHIWQVRQDVADKELLSDV